MSEVEKYIFENWEKTIRFNPDDSGTLIGLPKPYTVPSIADNFQEMYYWDTYFINRGLIISGRIDQAINNAENMFYLIDRFGFMPNGNRVYFLNNTQPPFLSLMVRDIYEETGDKDWLKEAVVHLKKEYKFWDKNRNTEIGLNQYSCNKEGAIKANKYVGFLKRLGARPRGCSDDELSIHYLTVCESGWDISPRILFKSQDYVEVDLNALLFAFEKNMGYFLEEIGLDGSKLWYNKAEKRKKLMERYMLTNGVFYDYNYKEKKISKQFTCASFYPMFVGMADYDQALALLSKLRCLEADYGITVDEKKDYRYKYQWHYPNGWAPHQNIVMRALKRYEFNKDALRVALKYMNLIEDNYKKTHNLWEKYNVVTGGIDVELERPDGIFDLPSMLGWTAGAYLDTLKLINNIVGE